MFTSAMFKAYMKAEVMAQSTLWQAPRKTPATDWWCSGNCFLIKSHECICLHTQPYISGGCTWGRAQQLLLSFKQLVHYTATNIYFIFFPICTLLLTGNIHFKMNSTLLSLLVALRFFPLIRGLYQRAIHL